MGCFLGCFGGQKAQIRRKQRVNRASPQRQRNRVQNVQQENVITAELSVKETAPIDLVSEVSVLGNKPEVVEQPSPSSRKRVTFNSNVTTYEHLPVHENIESLSGCAVNEKEKKEDLKPSSCSQSTSKDDDSVTSSVGSYPPNHRYHNARESDDEADEYGDCDLDDDEDEYSDEDISARFIGHEVWSESVSTASMEPRAGNFSPPAISHEVKELGSKTNGRDRSDYINSVLNPVENTTQWKAVKSKGTLPLKPQKENFPNFGQAPSGFKAKSHQLKNTNQEIEVDASLSNWLASPEITPSKNTTFSGFETTSSECCASARSFEDRPILGALTVEELRQISVSPSPRKSPSRNPDEMPIIGSVGTYWNNSSSAKNSGSVTSFKEIANTQQVSIYESGR